MKNSIELKELRGDKISELEAIKNIAEAEARDLNEAENQEVDTLLDDVKNLDSKIERAEKVEANLKRAAMISGSQLKTEKPKEFKQYSFFKAVKGYMNSNLEGCEKEMHDEACRSNVITGLGIPHALMTEKRADTGPQTTSNAAEFVATEVGEYLQTLQAKMVLGDLATFYSGLSSDVNLPVLSGTTAYFQTETSTPGDDAQTAVGGGTLQPKRLTATMALSKALLHQNASVERAIMDDLNGAVAAQIEYAALNGSGASGQPNGVANVSDINVVAAETDAALYYGKLLSMESEVGNNNADNGRMAYITTPKLRGKLKSTLAIANGDATKGYASGLPIWANNEINGLSARATTNCLDTFATNSQSQVLFGSWSDLVIASFGSANDVTIDPYTLAASGQIKIVINGYYDCLTRRGTSFAKIEGLAF
jgi:HK97 family phage major capsid protein